MWRINKVLLFLLILLSLNSIAQEKSSESKNYSGFYTVSPRLGLGVHNFLNFELGLTGLYIDNEGLNPGAASLYSTVVLQQSDWNSGFDIKGVKIGAQSSFSIFMWGIEYKNLFSGNSNYNYLSPKFGLSWLDVINIEYAVNIIQHDKNRTSPCYSRHQVSINFSINRKLYKEVYKNIF